MKKTVYLLILYNILFIHTLNNSMIELINPQELSFLSFLCSKMFYYKDDEVKFREYLKTKIISDENGAYLKKMFIFTFNLKQIKRNLMSI